jgi:hypothetical protein
LKTQQKLIRKAASRGGILKMDYNHEGFAFQSSLALIFTRTQQFRVTSISFHREIRELTVMETYISRRTLGRNLHKDNKTVVEDYTARGQLHELPAKALTKEL